MQHPLMHQAKALLGRAHHIAADIFGANVSFGSAAPVPCSLVRQEYGYTVEIGGTVIQNELTLRVDKKHLPAAPRLGSKLTTAAVTYRITAITDNALDPCYTIQAGKPVPQNNA